MADAGIWPAAHGTWLSEGKLRKRLAATVSHFDGVHMHGLWQASSLWAGRAARAEGKPTIVSAHGMLEPWALQQKAMKKRVYGALVERGTLNRAACLHALTAAEAEDYHRFGCTPPVAVIPNAVEAPPSIDRGLLLEMFPQLRDRRLVLFLGRLHIKKGIEILLRAWSRLGADHGDAALVLAGPGEEAYVQTLQARAAELGITDDVLFAGMLDGAAKWSALAAAHVFVLPSYSEGLSVATLEALAAGTPVIITDACHLPEAAAAGAGWEISPAADPLEMALRASLEGSGADRSAMSANARHLAKTRYSWAAVTAQMAELYGCVLGGGKPQLSEYREAAQ